MIQAETSLTCSETPSEGGKFAPLAVQKFEEPLASLRPGTGSHPAKPTTILAMIHRHFS